MAKRGANKQLTDMNYLNDSDEDDGQEEQWSAASNKKLKDRVIRKVKRGRNAPTTNNNENASRSGAFKLFSGFKTENSAAKPNFQSNFKAGDFNPPDSKIPLQQPSKLISFKTEETSKFGSPFVAADQKQSDNESKYHKKIASLNRSFLRHIQSNLDDNLLVDLSPLFTEYTQYMKKIETDRSKVTNTVDSVAKSSIGTLDSNIDSKPSITKAAFSFVPTTSKSIPSLPTTTSFATTNFRFAPSSSASSSSEVNKPAPPTGTSGSGDTAGNTGEEFAPEGFLPTSKPLVTEDDAIFSARCKLFYKLKKDDKDWKERGVGTIYLKKTETSGLQLVIRNDSSLGNILLNIAVSKTFPMSIVKEKNLSFITVANPPIDPKDVSTDPTTFLMRLKSATDATSLHDHIKGSA
ncbi:Nuclear pore complex protein Nup50 [Trichoplax sp. H2]|nr:Nuclear pore complex protein Nup50 [Trichoplax sp. H2]|eukprot:RDD40800.1 Nuclear pore complex protein Nup50 [Trichoplax sp. H2]